MILNSIHPISLVLEALAPLVGANFVTKSARDSETEADKYPLIEYVIAKEGKASYDYSKKSWRVELVVVFSFMLEEDDVKECIPKEELEDSLAVQGIQYSMTSKLRSLVQLMINPGSLGREFKEEDFSWSKYDFKLERFIESVYFRRHGSNEETGASSLFVLSLLDVDNTICCSAENLEQIYALLDPDSVSGRQLKLKIDAI